MSGAVRTSRQLFPVVYFLSAVKKHKRHLGFSHSHCLCAGCDLHQNRYFFLFICKFIYIIFISMQVVLVKGLLTCGETPQVLSSLFRQQVYEGAGC